MHVLCVVWLKSSLGGQISSLYVYVINFYILACFVEAIYIANQLMWLFCLFCNL